jgi:hypothetical protein
MLGTNQAWPHGVPMDWGFAQGPVIELGNNSNFNNQVGRAADAWGVLYEAADANGNNLNVATNTRVNFRHVRLYFKSKATGQWSQLQSTDAPEGALYYEDLHDQIYSSANVRTEPDGTRSVKIPYHGGQMYHFDAPPRVAFNPNDVGGWLAVWEARLVLDNANGVDDRASARYLGSCGADYWPTTTTGWTNFGGAPAIASGKMKYIGNSWRWFAITTVSQADLIANPPPVQLDGILP